MTKRLNPFGNTFVWRFRRFEIENLDKNMISDKFVIKIKEIWEKGTRKKLNVTDGED